MSFKTSYDKVKEEFYAVTKKILNYETRRELTDSVRKEQYVLELITVYNEFLKFVRENLKKQELTIINKVNAKFESHYEPNFLRCLHVLGFDTILPREFNKINRESLVTYEKQANDDNLAESLTNIDTSPLNSGDEHEKNANAKINEHANISNPETNQNKNLKMTLTKIDYHNMCTRTINTIFTGEPLALQPFIDAIEACEGLDENNTFTATLKSVILMKL